MALIKDRIWSGPRSRSAVGDGGLSIVAIIGLITAVVGLVNALIQLVRGIQSLHDAYVADNATRKGVSAGLTVDRNVAADRAAEASQAAGGKGPTPEEWARIIEGAPKAVDDFQKFLKAVGDLFNASPAARIDGAVEQIGQDDLDRLDQVEIT